MKSLTLLLIPLLLFMTGCSIDWNDEKEKKIAELEKQIQDDTFKKKQECSKIKKEEIIDQRKDSITIFGSNIIEVFYSKKKNSCIYTINETSLWGIYDYYSKEIILETESPLRSGGKEIEINFQNLLKELKGE